MQDFVNIPEYIAYMSNQTAQLTNLLESKKKTTKYLGQILLTKNLGFIKLVVPPNSIRYSDLKLFINCLKFHKYPADILFYVLDFSDKDLYDIFFKNKRVDLLNYCLGIDRKGIVKEVPKIRLSFRDDTFEYVKFCTQLGNPLTPYYYMFSIKSNNLEFVKWVISELGEEYLRNSNLTWNFLEEVKISHKNKEMMLWLYENKYLPNNVVYEMCVIYNMDIPENIVIPSEKSNNFIIQQLSVNIVDKGLRIALYGMNFGDSLKVLFYALKYDLKDIYLKERYKPYINLAKAVIQLRPELNHSCMKLLNSPNEKYILEFIDKYITDASSDSNLKVLKLIVNKYPVTLGKIFHFYEDGRKDVFFYILENMNISLKLDYEFYTFSKLCKTEDKFTELYIKLLNKLRNDYDDDYICCSNYGDSHDYKNILKNFVRYFPHDVIYENIQTLITKHNKILEYILKYGSELLIINSLNSLTQTNLSLYYAYRHSPERADVYHNYLLLTNNLQDISYYTSKDNKDSDFSKWILTKHFPLQETYDYKKVLKEKSYVIKYLFLYDRIQVTGSVILNILKEDKMDVIDFLDDLKMLQFPICLDTNKSSLVFNKACYCSVCCKLCSINRDTVSTFYKKYPK